MHQKLRNEQILLIGFPAWEGDYLKSTVQLATELAKENQVLYVEYPFTWKDALMSKWGRGKAPWKRILGKENRLRKLSLENGASIHVLTLPPILPINFINSEALYDSLMLGSAKKAFRAIQSAMTTLGMDQPVVVNAFNPFLGVFLARQFDEKALVYYCYDEISAAKWAGKHGPRLERHLMREADAVVTSSEPLMKAKQPFANQTYLVKNGVDFNLFNAPVANGSSIEKTDSPATVGYLGSLDERIDFDLLESTITTLPQYQFCFVGRVNSPEADRLRKYPNVNIMGSQSPADLPTLVQKMDVCLIPFLKNKLTAGIYPLKINEYFAAGKPVVSTDFGDLSDFGTLVSVSSNSDSFAKLIEKSLTENSTNLTKARINFAQQNSWYNRASEMGMAIRTVVAGRAELAARGEHSFIPNNYNRWGKVSERFFQPSSSGSNRPLKETSLRKTDQPYRQKQVIAENLVLLLPK